ncbi:hypothetical protein GmHk_14G040780 [Glycine max]|nr:hypothetical protein GmHk_14G040780 [Glycine max]
MQSQFQSQMQSQGLTLPQEPEVGPSGPRVSTKESCVAPSWNDPGTGDSDKCGLYIEENPSCLVALRRLYEGSRTVHNIPLLYAQVKAAVSPAKPPESPDEEVVWDATIFGVFNQNFPFYIKHEDLSEIAHDGQCLNISVIQLWILHLTVTSVRAGNSDVYGFLESQSIQRSGQSQFESESYIKSWIKSSKRDVYLGAYLKGGHWQMVVILPKENLVVWFCSLHNRPDNYLKGIISSSDLMILHNLNPRLLLGGLLLSVIDKKESLNVATT